MFKQYKHDNNSIRKEIYSINYYSIEYTKFDMIKQIVKGKGIVGEGFKDFPEEYEKYCKIKDLPKGFYLCTKYEKVKCVYAIISGEIQLIRELQNNHSYTHLILNEPTYMGYLEIITGTYIFAATVIATKNCKVIEMPVSVFEKWYDSDSNIVKVLAKMMGQFLYNGSLHKGDYVLHNSYYKMLKYLQFNYIDNQLSNGKLTISKPKTIIAREVGVSTKTIYRKIEELLSDNLITLENRNIVMSLKQFKEVEKKIKKMV